MDKNLCCICHKPILNHDPPVCSKDCEDRMELEIIHDREYRKAVADKCDAVVNLLRKEL